MSRLRLTIDGGPVINDPSPDDIENALRTLASEFAILERGELDYIQVALAADNEDLHVLEYQEGSLDRHYETDPVPLSSVIEAFQHYSRGEDAAWKSRFTWRRLEL